MNRKFLLKILLKSINYIVVFFALLLLLPSLGVSATVDPSLKWMTVETAHFSIHYYKGEEEIAGRLVEISEEAYQILSESFHFKPARTDVVVIDNHDLANGFTTVLPYNLIWLRVAPPASESTLADYDEWLRELFLHEFTHVIHITETGYPAKILKPIFGNLVAPNGLSPGWVTEGLATYFESAETTRGRGRSSFTEMLLRTDILKDRFLHLDQMAGTQFHWPGWMAQYLYGVAFWNYLAETYGQEKVMEFSRRYGSSLLLYALNHQAKKVFGASFYKLWSQWKDSLETRYVSLQEKLEKKGLEEGESFLVPKEGESFSSPTFARDGKRLAYVSTSVDHPQELRLRDLATGKEKILLRKKDIQQMSFSPDGKTLVVSYVQPYRRYYQFSDLHEIDIESGKETQLTKGLRARDADVSPDGQKIVAVLQKTGVSELGLYDRSLKTWEKVSEAYQFNHPRWLPDGKSIAVSVHRKGQRDLWIIDSVSRKERRLTSNIGMEDRLVSGRGNEVIFSSDDSGISNLYSYHPKDGKILQITNVLTGAFSPSVGPEGEVIFQYYNGKGFELRRLDVPSFVRRGEGEVGRGGKGIKGEEKSEGPPLDHSYRPFPKLLLPRYILPNVALVDNILFASFGINNMDPLRRHFWYADVTYRSDNQFVGFDGGYIYSRYRVPVSAGFNQYSVNFGDILGVGSDFFEARRRGFVGLSYPFSRQSVGLNYFFERRSEQSGLPAGTTLSTLGNYAGLQVGYSFFDASATSAAISTEEGGRFRISAEITDRMLGSSEQLEQKVVWGDARTFLRIPGTRHHVLALRAAGGAAFGDRLLQGNFSLGGSLGEGPFTGASTRLFTLRGLPLATFSRDRAWVASAEYRLPLFRVERGLGTLPFALNSAHFALFADVGDAYNRTNSSFRPLLGVGGEIRGDFVIGYYLPVMGRLGYGIIVTNRDRIAGIPDTLTGADARNGVIVLEAGTSF